LTEINSNRSSFSPYIQDYQLGAVAGLVVLAVVFAEFGIEVGMVDGLLAFAGGTIMGFTEENC